VLIGACPRSGTTLLRSLLDNHPDLAIPGETDLVFPLWRLRVRYGDLRRPENRRRMAEWIFRTEGFGGQRIRAGRDPEEAIERVVAAPPTLGSILATCFQMYAERKGKPRWGDKRPRYAGHIATVFALFPDAQFINLVRDPRAAVASQMPLGWADEGYELADSVANWETAVARVDAYAGRLRPDQLLDVRYEDLVRDPAATLRRICAFANLRDGETIERMIVSERRGSFREGWHDRLAEPISTAPIAAWRRRLKPAEVAVVERATGPRLGRFGYVAEPGLQVAPDPAELAKVGRRLRHRRRKWRRHAVDELKRRHVLYRHPLAAI
jgi:hypothetical protein